jgi:hypothetical protein
MDLGQIEVAAEFFLYKFCNDDADKNIFSHLFVPSFPFDFHLNIILFFYLFWKKAQKIGGEFATEYKMRSLK